MAPIGSSQILLSPAELSYLHSSLASNPPIRPDLRSPTQFRPLVAETDLLPSTNGSARVCFSDGTEAIVGIKAELEKTTRLWRTNLDAKAENDSDEEMGGDVLGESSQKNNSSEPMKGTSHDSWLEVSIDIPGLRDDDGPTIFLGQMLTEALLASKTLRDKLWINERWNWKLFIDILLLSPPLSYPLPLLSLTTHLALLNARLPRLISEPADDPLFDDDWAAAQPLYPRGSPGEVYVRPPITLLVISVEENIIFDPSREELAVADCVLAVTIAPQSHQSTSGLTLLAIRTIDPPSRLTPLGILDSANSTTSGATGQSSNTRSSHEAQGNQPSKNVWSPPRGGIKRTLISLITNSILKPSGIGEEVLEGLASVDT